MTFPSVPFTENARLQEGPAGVDLPDLVDNPAQLRPVDSDFPDLLLRVRRTALGYRPARC